MNQISSRKRSEKNRGSNECGSDDGNGCGPEPEQVTSRTDITKRGRKQIEGQIHDNLTIERDQNEESSTVGTSTNNK